ncbi:MAG TPA: AraC family transcriptional regulator [Aggregatilineales bacterium]|nr:AraC family transcriptional regulator [Aggregatilineales bacterium]
MERRIRDGFAGQKQWVIPRMFLSRWAAHPMLQTLIPTDIGWYPSAQYHYRERPEGAEQHILIFCVEGSGWYQIGDQIYTIEKYEALLIPRGQPHIYGASSSVPWSIHWVHFTGTEADLFVYHMPQGEYTLPIAPRCASLIENLFEECYESFIGGFVLYRLIYCTQVLHHLLGQAFFNNDFFSPTQRSSSFHSLHSTLTFLHQNINQNLKLSDMADHAGLSISHFSFLFKQQTGYSPMDYFIHLKMQRASAMLSLTDQTIHEIAFEIGYDDPYYFSRLFKKVMGVSPRHYRESPAK